jgi:hypothetical protein
MHVRVATPPLSRECATCAGRHGHGGGGCSVGVTRNEGRLGRCATGVATQRSSQTGWESEAMEAQDSAHSGVGMAATPLYAAGPPAVTETPHPQGPRLTTLDSDSSLPSHWSGPGCRRKMRAHCRTDDSGGPFAFWARCRHPVPPPRGIGSDGFPAPATRYRRNLAGQDWPRNMPDP